MSLAEELRHSMPNLARSSLRALEAVRSSRSLESDLQVPSSRIPRTQQRSAGQSQPPHTLRPLPRALGVLTAPCVPAGLTPSKLRCSSGAAPCSLTGRQLGKAASGGSSLLPGRQVGKPCSYTAPVPPSRKPQLHTASPSSSCTSRSTTMVTVAKGSALKARPAVGGVAVPKAKAAPPSRR